ncbi:MAG: hypothetical protein ABIP64_04690 [Burkholderiales bacterium]
MRKQTLSSLGQDHASRCSLKQCHLEIIFQRFDLCRDGGLTDVQRLARAGELAKLRNSSEGS